MGWFSNQMERSREAAKGSTYRQYRADKDKGVLVVPLGGGQWPLRECSAAVETGQRLEQMALSRVAAGALLLGPVGALLGGMAKKDKSRHFLAITVPGQPPILEQVGTNDLAGAKRFAAYLNAAAEEAAS